MQKKIDFFKILKCTSTLKKKCSPTAAVVVAFTVFEIKKTKNFMKLKYISYTMTLKKNIWYFYYILYFPEGTTIFYGYTILEKCIIILL